MPVTTFHKPKTKKCYPIAVFCCFFLFIVYQNLQRWECDESKKLYGPKSLYLFINRLNPDKCNSPSSWTSLFCGWSQKIPSLCCTIFQNYKKANCVQAHKSPHKSTLKPPPHDQNHWLDNTLMLWNLSVPMTYFTDSQLSFSVMHLIIFNINGSHVIVVQRITVDPCSEL